MSITNLTIDFVKSVKKVPGTFVERTFLDLLSTGLFIPLSSRSLLCNGKTENPTQREIDSAVKYKTWIPNGYF